MISNKLRLILSGIATILLLYVFITSGKKSFNTINIGLFIMFTASFITSLVSQMKNKKRSK